MMRPVVEPKYLETRRLTTTLRTCAFLNQSLPPLCSQNTWLSLLFLSFSLSLHLFPLSLSQDFPDSRVRLVAARDCRVDPGGYHRRLHWPVSNLGVPAPRCVARLHRPRRGPRISLPTLDGRSEGRDRRVAAALRASARAVPVARQWRDYPDPSVSHPTVLRAA